MKMSNHWNRIIYRLWAPVYGRKRAAVYKAPPQPFFAIIP